MIDSPEHAELVRRFTGGLAPGAGSLQPFAGSERLRPDGRPRPEFRSRLRKIPNLQNAWTSLWTLSGPIAVVWLTIAIDRWWAVVVAFFVMGSFFPRFYILNHEAAHRLLFSNRRANDLIGERLSGLIAFGDGSSTYRMAHTQHHRDEFGPKEPDFLLYSRYPIPKASFRRKLMRDAFGSSGWKNLRPALVGLFRADRRIRALKTIGAQGVIFALFFLAGHPLLYLLIWFLPWMTYWRVVNRLRALAEHAGMTRSDDRRFTTHHVHQRRLSAFFFVPYNTGYHLAHHVDSGIPWRSLPVLHRALVEDGYMTGVTIHGSYPAFWRTLYR